MIRTHTGNSSHRRLVEMPRVMVDMSATLLHHGHIILLEAAALKGEVVVALTSDSEVKRQKGYFPELNFSQRKQILEAISFVSEVVESPWLIDEAFLDFHECDFLMHGDDNTNNLPPDRVVTVARTKDISSSMLRQIAAKIAKSLQDPSP